MYDLGKGKEKEKEKGDETYGKPDFGNDDTKLFKLGYYEKSKELKKRGIWNERIHSILEPSFLAIARNPNDFELIKNYCDSITLLVRSLPEDPYVREIDYDYTNGANQSQFRSILGQLRDFQDVIQKNEIDFKGFEKTNATSYICDYTSDEILERRIRLLSDYCKKRKLRPQSYLPEWLHIIANCLGGPVTPWNGAAGGHGANTKMAVIENNIQGQPGIGVEVTCYAQPNTRIAEWFTYKIFAYDNKKEEIDSIIFEIDGQQHWYKYEDAVKDLTRIKEFLKKQLIIEII